jgi:ribonuclease D
MEPTAESSKYRPAITREEINALPLYRYTGPIHVIGEPGQVKAAVAALRRERVLGFDTETRAAFHKGESYPPALVQLAASNAVYLFQLRALPNLAWFERVLGDAGVIKAGVSIGRDLKELQALHAFEPAGFVELAEMSDAVGVTSNGIRGLAAIVLGCRISKNAQRSNWGQPALTPVQIAYAATDAWICRKLYLRLEEALSARSAGPA